MTGRLPPQIQVEQALVETLSLAPVTVLQAPCEGGRTPWHGHQTNVIRHQAPAEQTDSVAGAVLQRLQVLPPVFVRPLLGPVDPAALKEVRSLSARRFQTLSVNGIRGEPD